MNQDMSKDIEVHALQAMLQDLQKQNTCLSAEKELLRRKVNELRSTSVVNVEARIKAQQMEDERDLMYENLEKLKKKYNKLHDAYLNKVKKCKALEETFKRQKTLTGLVLKSSLQQKQALTDMLATETLEKKVEKLEAALDEAYNIIDELEFELESIDYLELENQRLRNELMALKAENRQTIRAAGTASGASPMPDDHEMPPIYKSYDNVDGAVGATAAQRLSTASSSSESSCADDADSETLERAALTHSLVQNAEVESNKLRRELLKCRLQNTRAPKL